MKYEEGENCPDCTHGELLYQVEGCRCHRGNPPCSACTDAQLKCDSCGAWESELPEKLEENKAEQRLTKVLFGEHLLNEINRIKESLK